MRSRKGRANEKVDGRWFFFFFFLLLQIVPHLGLLHTHGRRPRRGLPSRRGADRVALRVGRVIPGRGRDGGHACPGHDFARKKKRSTNDDDDDDDGRIRRLPLSPRGALWRLCVEGRRRSSHRRWRAPIREKRTREQEIKNKGKVREKKLVRRWAPSRAAKKKKSKVHCSLSPLFALSVSLFAFGSFLLEPRGGALSRTQSFHVG